MNKTFTNFYNKTFRTTSSHCPEGFYRDRKTQNCEKMATPSNSTRCPKGQRRIKGICVKIESLPEKMASSDKSVSSQKSDGSQKSIDSFNKKYVPRTFKQNSTWYDTFLNRAKATSKKRLGNFAKRPQDKINHFQLDDTNIKACVIFYMQNHYYGSAESYYNLPDAIRDLEMNEWDVRHVTNMERLFKDYEYFDEPLEKWGNKLGNVTTMREMFNGCNSFDHSLSNWKINSNTDVTNMFKDCEISEEYLPPNITVEQIADPSCPGLNVVVPECVTSEIFRKTALKLHSDKNYHCSSEKKKIVDEKFKLLNNKKRLNENEMARCLVMPKRKTQRGGRKKSNKKTKRRKSRK